MNKTHLSTLIIAVAVLGSAYLLSNAYTNRNKGNDTISVTGLGSKDFTSDLIVWSGSFHKKNLDLKQAYAELGTAREAIQAYLVEKGIPAEKLIFSAIDIEQQFDNRYDDEGNQVSSIFTGYRLQQSVQIESNEVEKVEEISRNVTELINSGIEFYSNTPNYYYTKLAELKIEMIAEATKDAQVRAQKIADNAGGSLGNLKSADMGVFQIVGQNSSEDYSWGGSFNTSSKNKTASITVNLRYESND
jgi:uncharacterized protein